MPRSPRLLRSRRALAPPCAAAAAADDIAWRRDPGEREMPARWMSVAKRDKDRVTEIDEECMLIF